MTAEWDGQHWRDESGMQVPDPGFPAWKVVLFFSAVGLALVGFGALAQIIFG